MKSALIVPGKNESFVGYYEEGDVNIDMKRYQRPERMIVSKVSDPKNVKRRLDFYKHKTDDRVDLYVLLRGKKVEDIPFPLFGGGVTAHKGLKTTKTYDMDPRPPKNVVFFGKQTNHITYTGESAAKNASGSYGDDEGRERRHHRRRGSGEPEDKYDDPPKDDKGGHGHRQERRGKGARDHSRDGFDLNGRGNDVKDRKNYRPIDSASDSSSDSDHESTKNPKDGFLQSDHSRKAPSRHSTIQSTAHTHTVKEDPTKECSEIQPLPKAKSTRGYGSVRSAQRPSSKASLRPSSHESSSEIQALPEVQSIKGDESVRSAQRPSSKASFLIPSSHKSSSEVKAISEVQSIRRDGSAVSAQRPPSSRPTSSRPPSERSPSRSRSGQSRSSGKDYILAPDLESLIEEKLEHLNMAASQGELSVTSQSSKFADNRRRRREERSGLSSNNQQ
ncbi:hypothetical protein EAE96_004763 [Botrytis aclada]|nr:hypothetical protein EAE96_004763 [Botrytis aclada]